MGGNSSFLQHPLFVWADGERWETVRKKEGGVTKYQKGGVQILSSVSVRRHQWPSAFCLGGRWKTGN